MDKTGRKKHGKERIFWRRSPLLVEGLQLPGRARMTTTMLNTGGRVVVYHQTARPESAEKPAPVQSNK